jgi:hypothetical protein
MNVSVGTGAGVAVSVDEGVAIGFRIPKVLVDACVYVGGGSVSVGGGETVGVVRPMKGKNKRSISTKRLINKRQGIFYPFPALLPVCRQKK